MAFEPRVEERPSLVERVGRNPKKHLIDMLRGMARGTAALPGDVADLLTNNLPNPAGLPTTNLGGATRDLMNKTDALKETGAPLEQGGELFGAPVGGPVKGAALAGSMLVGAGRAVKGGMLNPQALIDAIRMWKSKRPGEEIWSQTGVHVSNPRVMQDTPIALAPIETKGYNLKDKQGIFPEVAPLGNMSSTGDVVGMDEMLKLYPEMNSTLVKKITNANEPMGSFSPSRNEIMVNYAGKGTSAHEAGKTLAHEATHGIQGLDNMPRGTDVGPATDVVRRIGPHLAHSDDQLQTAFLLRGLLEDRGLAGRASVGHLNPIDAMEMMRGNKSFKGMAVPTGRTMNMALNTSADDIQQRLELIGALRNKMPANPADAYLKTWGEAMARRNEGMVDTPVSQLLRSNLRSFDKHQLRDSDLFDIAEFSPSTLKKAGLLY